MMAKIVILILSCDNLSFLINNFIFSVFFSDHFLDIACSQSTFQLSNSENRYRRTAINSRLSCLAVDFQG